MTLKRNIRLFLIDIFESINRIEAYTKGMSKESFISDAEALDAVVRRIEILGEAAKNIPSDFKKANSDAPWAEMTRTRDKLTHGYFEVNAERIWFIVKDDLPDAKKKIKKLLDTFGENIK